MRAQGAWQPKTVAGPGSSGRRTPAPAPVGAPQQTRGPPPGPRPTPGSGSSCWRRWMPRRRRTSGPCWRASGRALRTRQSASTAPGAASPSAPQAPRRRRAAVRAHLGRLSALRAFHGKSSFYGAFVWVRRALDRSKRRFPARAVADIGGPWIERTHWVVPNTATDVLVYRAEPALLCFSTRAGGDSHRR